MTSQAYQTVVHTDIPYRDALKEMQKWHAMRVLDDCPDTMMILEHQPVVTKGRRLHGQTIPGEDRLRAKGIAIEDADRGGLLTYHGPGQLVIYPIIKITQLNLGPADTVHRIEAAIQYFLKDFNIVGVRKAEFPGIWVDDRKLASIGLRIQQGVVMHGVSLNLSNDLLVYQDFAPCGLDGAVMTRLRDLIKKELSPADTISIGKVLAHQIWRHMMGEIQN